MGPHVTILSNFYAAEALDDEVRAAVRTLFAGLEPLTFTLDELGRFPDPGVLYLEPTPTDELLRLHEAVIGEFSIEASDPVFHLTLAGWHPGDLDRLEQEFREAYGDRVPIAAAVNKVTLYARIGNVWHRDSEYALGLVEPGTGEYHPA